MSVNFYRTIGWVLLSIWTATVWAKDLQPEPFAFVAQVGVERRATVQSNTVKIVGIDAPVPIKISGGQYSLDGRAFTAKAGTVQNGQSLTLQQIAKNAYQATGRTQVSIGGVKARFDVTTRPKIVDNVPDKFSFAARQNVEPDTEVISEPATIAGINVPVTIRILNGSYAINDGPFVTGEGKVVSGDAIRVKLVTSALYSNLNQAMVTIGGVRGYFNVATLANPLFVLPPLEGGSSQFASEHFVGYFSCMACHDNLKDQNGADVSIVTDWSSTMMANATRDPFWRAKVRSELNRNPQLAGLINDKCSRCHAPMANFEAKSKQESLAILDNGVLEVQHSRHNEAMIGVSCTLCHQIENTPKLGTLDGFSGRYAINDKKNLYGPFPNPVADGMVIQTGYTPIYAPHIKESKLCAVCHNLKTAFVDENGQVLSTTPDSEFPEQMPYSEWENSIYAGSEPKSCQACHMTRADGVAIATNPANLAKRDGFAIHEFVGSNRLMLDIFDNNKQQLGVQANNFAETLSKTEAILNRAATLEIVTPTLQAGVLSFTVKIASQTGHKLPTSYPSRRVIVHVTVKDGQGNTVFESGKVGEDGKVDGADSDADRTLIEPHYDLITQADQVQIYEAVMSDNHSQPTYTLLRGMRYLKDNRLLPPGFDKAKAASDVAVVGDALSDANFQGGSDLLNYRIGGLAAGNYLVEVELLHQPLSQPFAADLFTEHDAEIEDFKTLFDRSKLKTSRMAVHRFNVAG